MPKRKPLFFVVLYFTPVSKGVRLYGPFATEEDGIAWAKKHVKYNTWTVREAYPPYNINVTGHAHGGGLPIDGNL